MSEWACKGCGRPTGGAEYCSLECKPMPARRASILTREEALGYSNVAENGATLAAMASTIEHLYERNEALSRENERIADQYKRLLQAAFPEAKAEPE